MSWLDIIDPRSLIQSLGLHMHQSVRNLKNHGENKLTEARLWGSNQFAERRYLLQERQAMRDQVDRLRRNKDMDPGQRSAAIWQLRSQMPGYIASHSHPFLSAGKSLGGVFWHAAKGGGRIAAGTARLGARAVGGVARGTRAIAPVVTPGSNTVLIVLAVFYHLAIFTAPTMDLGTRLGLNIILLLLTVFLIFDASEKNGDTYRFLFMGIFIFEILIPYIASTVSIIQQVDFVRLYLANSMIVWTWLWYAVFVRGKNLGGFTKVCRWLLVLFYLGAALSLLLTSFQDFSDVELDTASADQQAAFEMIVQKSIEGWDELLASVTTTIATMQDTVDMRLKQASGEYYYGVVEENEGEKLGVYLENLKTSQSLYEEYEPVNVYATLRAYTLDDTVNVNIACYEGKDDEPNYGKVYPDEAFEVYNLQEEELDCSFDRLDMGTNKITFTANFNFETIGYLKRYFADRDAVIAATREDIDLLDEYQILDQSPVAHYTNGPVKIGMGPDQALIGVSETYTVKPRLALTLDSGWDGQISQLHEVVLIIPSEMSLDTSTCSHHDITGQNPGWQTYDVDNCVASETTWESSVYRDCDADASCIEDVCSAQLENYNAYVLDVSSSSTYKDIEDYVTISCRLNIDNVPDLLGATPIATHYFYVKTRYDYELSETTKAVVEEYYDPAAKTTRPDGVPEPPPYTFDERDEHLQYIFYYFGDKLFAAETEYGIPACAQAGLIALVSGGDAYYSDNGRYGLFGVTESISNLVGVSTTNLYNIDSNFKAAGTYLKNLTDSYGAFNDDVLKSWHHKLFIENLEEIEDKESADLERFKDIIAKYVETCEELYLDDVVDRSASNDVSVVRDALREGAVYGVYFDSAPYSPSAPEPLSTQLLGIGSAPDAGLLIDKSIVATYTGFDVILQHVTTDVGSVSFGWEDTAEEHIEDIAQWFLESRTMGALTIEALNEWDSFDEHPLIQVSYDPVEDALLWRALDDFTVNVNLLEDEELELVQDYLYVKYTGSDIIFKVANNEDDATERTKICHLHWVEEYSYLSCDDTSIINLDIVEDLPGLIVRNLGTKEDWLGTGYANVQIEWSNQRQFEAVVS